MRTAPSGPASRPIPENAGAAAEAKAEAPPPPTVGRPASSKASSVAAKAQRNVLAENQAAVS